jgi:hypothetical protein
MAEPVTTARQEEECSSPIWTHRPLEPTFFFHEMGHEFGLDHSFGESPALCAGGDVRPGVYCDMFDIMSAMNVHSFQDALNRRSGPTLNGMSRATLVWLQSSRIWSMKNQSLGGSCTSVFLS